MSSKLVNCAAIFIVKDVMKTAEFYKNILGFRVEEHFDNPEQFAALYRDDIELIIIQAKYGEIISNRSRYGAGYDVYFSPENIEGVDSIYNEFKEKGVRIVNPPSLKPYGSYEFCIEDNDGRLLGFGCIKHKDKFFRKGNCV